MRYRGEYLHDVNRLHYSLDEETFTGEGFLATFNSEKKSNIPDFDAMIAKNYEVKKPTYFMQELKYFVTVPYPRF